MNVSCTRRGGFTLTELLVVLFVFSILLGLAVMRINAALDRAATRAATQDAAAVFSSARNAAIYRRAPVAVRIDAARGTIQARCDTVVVSHRDLSREFGVGLTSTRDSMAYDARGIGIGAANLSLIASRGGSTDTLFISRLGRVRY